MTKKSNNQNNNRNNIVEEYAALGFIVGTVVWFCIYFPKSELALGKLVLYLLVGSFIGGMLGELIQYFKNKKL